MKKANIILSAIGLLSVIGGALAFKAQHRFGGTLACYTSNSSITNHKFINASYTTGTAGTLLCTLPGENAYVATPVRQAL